MDEHRGRHELFRLYLCLSDERGRDATVVVEVEVLGPQLVLVAMDRLVKVRIEVERVDEGLFLPQNRHQNVLDANFKLCCIDISEVLFVPFELQVFLVVMSVC